MSVRFKESRVIVSGLATNYIQPSVVIFWGGGRKWLREGKEKEGNILESQRKGMKNSIIIYSSFQNNKNPYKCLQKNIGCPKIKLAILNIYP